MKIEGYNRYSSIFRKQAIVLFVIRKGLLIKIIKMLIPIILLGLAIFEIQKSISAVDVNLLQHEVGQLQSWKLILILLISFSAITPMIFYDVLLVKVLKIKMKTKHLVQNSLIVNTFSNLIGFGGLLGVFLRNYFYSKYKVEKEGMFKDIASVTFFYLTGISLLAWIVPLFYWDFHLLRETEWLLVAVLLLSLYFPVFIGIRSIRNRKGNTSLLSAKISLQLIVTSLVEWISIFLLIWSITLILNIPIGITTLFPIFLIAACAGIVSMIPGGLGSFDLVFLWGTQSVGIADEKVLFLLILYRLSYFFLPFILSALLFVKEYWEKWNRSWDDLPNIIFQKVSHTLLTILVFASGVVLLLSASIPGILSRLKIAQEFLSLPFMNVSHQLTVAAGFILLGLCRGIQYKVKRAYVLTIIVLSSAALFSIFRGFKYEEAIFLLIVTALIIAAKKQFYRESYVLTWGIAIFDLAIIIIITTMYVFIGYINLPISKFQIPAAIRDYIITDYTDLFYSAIIGLIIAFVILYIGYIIHKPEKIATLSSLDQEEKIKKHLSMYPGTEFSHLIFLHDKNIYWNKEETVLFSYQFYADKIVVLGNPVGKEAHFSSATEGFLELADRYGFTIIFYEINNSFFPNLHEHGFDFFKLGEEAFVDLKSTLIEEEINIGKYEQEGFLVEIINPPFSSELLNELENISTKWLQGRAEKGFSLSFFDKNYLNKSKIAILKKQNEIIGFSSLMPMYGQSERISMDLMRFTPDAEIGSLDYLLISLFQRAKKENYRHFNIGMSSLSNVGQSKYSFLSEKIAGQIFTHGQHSYDFKGLKDFQIEHADFWESKYLAYRKKSSLTFTMMQITLLIGNKRSRYT
ncbi:bifunctional lysylphosphatidylglycerol flippase/synthetase MprF [Sporosarcina sp. FA9]|uniref:bifunctional lysylphosphatidylglycerol flippase/synthetase MprF n=1 Tax=Sporosarcina sp. FA9 TaxID=3413030 RepID=UPI003F65A1B9